jgi:rhodanese-related sulfurtransferase
MSGLVAAHVPRNAPRTIVRDALLVLGGCALLGIAVNALRSNGIPLVQETDYQILVPCPDGTGEAPAITATDPAIGQARTLLIDARAMADYDRWHPNGAVHLAYDYLEPAPAEQVHRIASSGARRVVVVGDGGDPDCGEQLARELAGAGIRNVSFVKGGARALQEATAGGTAGGGAR